jgi:peptide/nickel transport system substrate-binding protein
MAPPNISRRGLLQLGGSVALLMTTGACAAGSKSDSKSGASAGPAATTLRVAVSSYLSSWDQDFVGFDLTALMLFKNF